MKIYSLVEHLNIVELVGVRSDTTIEPSTLTIGNNLLIHDATFSGSGPYVIQLQNSDIDAKNIKFENIKRTSTSNGPFYLLGLMGNSSNVKAEGIEFLEVNSDTGFLAIEIELPDSTLEVGYIDINNLTAKNGSYLEYSAGISSAGSVTATNEIRISNLEANTDDLFAVYAEGLRKLFKNPCSQAELNKIVPFGFSLQHQKMVFFAIKIV